MEHASTARPFLRWLGKLQQGGFPAAVHLVMEEGPLAGHPPYPVFAEPRLSICLEGKGEYLARRDGHAVVIAVRPGEVIYAAPGCTLESAPAARYLSLGIVYGSGLTRFLIGRKTPASARGPGHRFVSVHHSETVLDPVDALLHRLLVHRERSARDLYLRQLMAALIARTGALLHESSPPHRGGGKAQLHWLAACQFVREHLAEPFNREDVARFLRLHPNHISRLFARRGEAFNSYVNRLRMERARELLRTSNLNVAEVALASGFTDPNYFTRRFRTAFGCSPTQLPRP